MNRTKQENAMNDKSDSMTFTTPPEVLVDAMVGNPPTAVKIEQQVALATTELTKTLVTAKRVKPTRAMKAILTITSLATVTIRPPMQVPNRFPPPKISTALIFSLAISMNLAIWKMKRTSAHAIKLGSNYLQR